MPVLQDSPELVAAELRATAKTLFPSDDDCNCDVIIGYVCEACKATALMRRAAALIESLAAKPTT
jgi:hypothetical protein